MEEAMVRGYGTVVERLERAAGILGGETMAGALGVSEEVVERYLTGEVAYPEEGEWMERLGLLDEMCESLGGFVDEVMAVEGRVAVDAGVILEVANVAGPVDRFAGDLERCRDLGPCFSFRPENGENGPLARVCGLQGVAGVLKPCKSVHSDGKRVLAVGLGLQYEVLLALKVLAELVDLETVGEARGVVCWRFGRIERAVFGEGWDSLLWSVGDERHQVAATRQPFGMRRVGSGDAGEGVSAAVGVAPCGNPCSLPPCGAQTARSLSIEVLPILGVPSELWSR